MSLQGAVRTILIEDPAVASLLIGSDGRFRYYPIKLQSGTALPATTYGIVSNERRRTLGGDQQTPIARLSLRHWADSYSNANQVAAAVRTALVNFRGVVNADVIMASALDNELDQFDDDSGKYSVIQDFLFTYRE